MAKKKSKSNTQFKEYNSKNDAFNNVDAFEELKKRENQKKLDSQQNNANNIQNSKPIWNPNSPKKSKINTSINYNNIDKTEDLYEDALEQNQEQLSDEELFMQSVGNLKEQDIYKTKFSQKEIYKKNENQVPKLTMSEEEREIAIFTQEMAAGNVKRLDNNKISPLIKNSKKKTNSTKLPIRVKSDEIDSIINNTEENSNLFKKTEESDTRLPEPLPTKQPPQPVPAPTPEPQPATNPCDQSLIDDVIEHQTAFGPIPTLKLRGLSPDAAIERLQQFIDAFHEQLNPFASIIINGPYVPVSANLKTQIIQILTQSQRIQSFIASPTNNNGFYLRINREFCHKDQT